MRIYWEIQRYPTYFNVFGWDGSYGRHEWGYSKTPKNVVMYSEIVWC